MTEELKINQERALSKGLAALETMATIWAAQADLEKIAQVLAAVADATRASRIREMIKQGFMEGAYQHYLDRDPAAQAATTAPSMGKAYCDFCEQEKLVAAHDSTYMSGVYRGFVGAWNRLPQSLPAWRDVVAERQRQISVEGKTTDHDDANNAGDLAAAASAYALNAACQLNPYSQQPLAEFPLMWPSDWAAKWWKPKKPREDLVRAGALVLAEIERIDRGTEKGAAC
jgi:hypothetical protein